MHSPPPPSHPSFITLGGSFVLVVQIFWGFHSWYLCLAPCTYQKWFWKERSHTNQMVLKERGGGQDRGSYPHVPLWADPTWTWWSHTGAQVNNSFWKNRGRGYKTSAYHPPHIRTHACLIKIPRYVISWTGLAIWLSTYSLWKTGGTQKYKGRGNAFPAV